MSLVAIITDTHFGVRGDSISFQEYFTKFYNNIFFPTIDSLGIKRVLHLGDLVDRRKLINYNTSRHMKKEFLNPIADRKLRFDAIVGNHDTFYKTTNEINSLNEVKDAYPDFNIYTDATDIDVDGLSVLLVPWICSENYKRSIETIEASKSQVAMGHLELLGFEQNRGIVSTHGMDQRVFDKFDLVFSGHYHHRSNNGSIFYLGAPAEFTWSDYDDPRGFHIFDTDTRELQFIQNPYKMFNKILYDDTAVPDQFQLLNHDFDQYRNTTVKVIVRSRKNTYWFDSFLDKLESHSPLDVSIVEDHGNRHLVSDETITDEVEDTLTLFRQEVESMSISDNEMTRLNEMINALYDEALHLE